MAEDKGRLDVSPCCYCNSDALYIDVVTSVEGLGYTVACRDCGMSGPISFQGIELAIRGWEVLHKKMCRHCMDRLIEQNKKLHRTIKELVGESA